MAFEDFTSQAGRLPIWVVEIDLTACTLNWGAAPCTATGPAGSQCYKTYATCQDTPNFSPNDSPFAGAGVYVFCSSREFIESGAVAIPCIQGDPAFRPAVIDPGKGLGTLGGVVIQMRDFNTDEPYIPDLWDPYRSARTSDPVGTWWNRLLARNPHYQGRTMRLYLGYKGAAYPSEYQRRDYVIETIKPGGQSGVVEIVAKDPLKLADDKRAKVPRAIKGTLSADLDDNDISFTIDETTNDFDTAVSVVRIDDELMSYITQAGGSFSGVARGTFNTTATAHDEGATVQQVKRLTTKNVAEMVYYLLANHTEIPAAYLDAAEFDPEGWMNQVMVAATLVEPVGVRALITELAEQAPFAVWWDEIDRKVKLRAVAPVHPDTAPVEITDEDIVKDSVSIDRLDNERVSRVFVYYGQINPVEGDDVNNYSDLYIKVNSDAESDALYGKVRERQIKSRWFDADDQVSVITGVGRIIQRYGDPPIKVSLLLDVKDQHRIRTGQQVLLSSKWLQDVDGSPLPTNFQVVDAHPERRKGGHSWRVNLMSLGFSGRYAYLGFSSPDYSGASAAYKARYGYIGPSAGNFADGGLIYKVV